MNETATIRELLSKKEFYTFVLLYAAHTDYEFSESERNFICKVGDVSTFNKIYDLFLQTSDYACMKYILRHRALYFSNKKDEDFLFNLIKQLFEADGDFSRIEQSFEPFFRRMINL